jgi:hypothetical protein
MARTDKVDWRIRMMGFYEPRIESLVPAIEHAYEYSLFINYLLHTECSIDPVTNNEPIPRHNANQLSLF